MTENSIVNLLIVDRIDSVTDLLRDGGYIVQTERLEQEADVVAFIQSKSVDLIVAKPMADLASIGTIRTALAKAGKTTPVIALLDNHEEQPALAAITEALTAGADMLCLSSDTDLFLAAVKKELSLRQLQAQADEHTEKLKEAEKRSREIMDNADRAIAYIHEGVHMYVNPAYFNLFGYATSDDLLGVTLMDMVSSNDRNQVKRFLRDSTRQGTSLEPLQLTGLRTDGSEMAITMQCSPTRIDDEPCLQIDISADDGKDDASSSVHGDRDPATDLYTRQFFTDYISKRIDDPNKRRQGSIAYILLEAYRPLNNRFGLAAGDVLIREQAKKLAESLSENDIVARFGDGVLAVFMPEANAKHALSRASDLCKAIKDNAAYLEQSLLTTNASIGVASLESDYAGGALGLISLADQACEQGRRAGGNRAVDGSTATVVTAAASEKAADEEAIELIHAAISSERMRLLYQPVVSFADDSKQRYQILMQILDENDEPLEMQRLAPVAERTNLMLPLDKWTIVTALATLTERYQEDQSLASLFVQVSGNAINDDDFPEWLEMRIKDTGLPANVVIVELLEEVAEKHFKEAKRFRDKLQSLGCGFSLANFGGKSNSERILNHLTPDYIKLDSELLERQSKTKGGAIDDIANLTQQAQAMNAQVVAANIANASQMASIWQFGVTLVQGDMVHQPDADMTFDFAEFAAG